jgi:hypothetical protein
MKLLKKFIKLAILFFEKTYEMDTLAYRKREWDWMNNIDQNKNE